MNNIKRLKKLSLLLLSGICFYSLLVSADVSTSVDESATASLLERSRDDSRYKKDPRATGGDCKDSKNNAVPCWDRPVLKNTTGSAESGEITRRNRRSHRSARSLPGSGSNLIPDSALGSGSHLVPDYALGSGSEFKLTDEGQTFIEKACDAATFSRTVVVEEDDNLQEVIKSYVSPNGDKYSQSFWVDFSPAASTPWDKDENTPRGILFVLHAGSTHTINNLQLSYVNENADTEPPSSPRVGICGLAGEQGPSSTIRLVGRSAYSGGGVPEFDGLDDNFNVWVGPLLILQTQLELYNLTLDADSSFNELPAIQMHSGGKLFLQGVTAFRNTGDTGIYDGIIYSGASFLQLDSSNIKQTTKEGTTIFSDTSVTRVFNGIFHAENTVCSMVSIASKIEVYGTHFQGSPSASNKLPVAHASFLLATIAEEICTVEVSECCMGAKTGIYPKPEPDRRPDTPGGGYVATYIGDCTCEDYLYLCKSNDITLRGNRFFGHWNHLLDTFLAQFTNSNSNVVAGEFNRCASDRSTTIKGGDMSYSKDGVVKQCVHPVDTGIQVDRVLSNTTGIQFSSEEEEAANTAVTHFPSYSTPFITAGYLLIFSLSSAL